MWNAEWGIAMKGRSPREAHPYIPHSAFRIPHSVGWRFPPPVPPPSDAIVLFDGKDLLQWQSQDGTPAKWPVRDGFAEVAAGTGPIITRRVFGDVQLHIEWATPSPPKGEGQERGNSGVFLMSHYEIQVLDSYRNE